MVAHSHRRVLPPCSLLTAFHVPLDAARPLNYCFFNCPTATEIWHDTGTIQ